VRRARALVVAAALAALSAASTPAFACPSCFSRAEGPLVDAARAGMWLLLAVTLALQGGFVAFFLYLRRRATAAADQALDEEWSRLQRGRDGSGR
jgi:hypothetical protein